MEIKRKGRFITDFYGGKPYLTGDKVVSNWLGGQQDKLLNPRLRDLKNAIGNETELEKILSVFNVDVQNKPVIGSWMLVECARNAHKMAGIWSKFNVSADKWKNSINFVPTTINLFNGKIISEPQGVEVYTVTIKEGGKSRSFFKAYQLIKVGATFECILEYPEDLCERIAGKDENKQKIFESDEKKSKECAEAVLNKMEQIGLGAYRARFGKFEWI